MIRFTKTIKDITKELDETVKSVMDGIEFFDKYARKVGEEECAIRKKELHEDIDGIRYLILIVEEAYKFLPNLRKLDERFKEITGL